MESKGHQIGIIANVYIKKSTGRRKPRPLDYQGDDVLDSDKGIIASKVGCAETQSHVFITCPTRVERDAGTGK